MIVRLRLCPPRLPTVSGIRRAMFPLSVGPSEWRCAASTTAAAPPRSRSPAPLPPPDADPIAHFLLAAPQVRSPLMETVFTRNTNGRDTCLAHLHRTGLHIEGVALYEALHRRNKRLHADTMALVCDMMVTTGNATKARVVLRGMSNRVRAVIKARPAVPVADVDAEALQQCYRLVVAGFVAEGDETAAREVVDMATRDYAFSVADPDVAASLLDNLRDIVAGDAVAPPTVSSFSASPPPSPGAGPTPAPLPPKSTPPSNAPRSATAHKTRPPTPSKPAKAAPPPSPSPSPPPPPPPAAPQPPRALKPYAAVAKRIKSLVADGKALDALESLPPDHKFGSGLAAGILEELLSVVASAEHVAIVTQICLNRCAAGRRLPDALALQLVNHVLDHGSIDDAVDVLTRLDAPSTDRSSSAASAPMPMASAWAALVTAGVDQSRPDVVAHVYKRATDVLALRSFATSKPAFDMVLKQALADKEPTIAHQVYIESFTRNILLDSELLIQVFDLLLESGMDVAACSLLLAQSDRRHALPPEYYAKALDVLCTVERGDVMGLFWLPGDDMVASGTYVKNLRSSTLALVTHVFGEATLAQVPIPVETTARVVQFLGRGACVWSLHRVLACIPSPSTMPIDTVYAPLKMPYLSRHTGTGITHQRNVAALRQLAFTIRRNATVDAERWWERPGRVTMYGDLVLTYTDEDLQRLAASIPEDLVSSWFRPEDDLFRMASSFLWRHCRRLDLPLSPTATLHMLQCSIGAAITKERGGIAVLRHVLRYAFDTHGYLTDTPLAETIIFSQVALGNSAAAIRTCSSLLKSGVGLSSQCFEKVVRLCISSGLEEDALMLFDLQSKVEAAAAAAAAVAQAQAATQSDAGDDDASAARKVGTK